MIMEKVHVWVQGDGAKWDMTAMTIWEMKVPSKPL